MPRIPTALLRKARTIDAFLPALLAPCRDLHTAQNELRWLREHVEKVAKARRAKRDTLVKGALLGQLVRERAKGKPLQYLLGTEYFGDLEIKCRPGVLIPRQDTAASVTHLAKLVRTAPNLPAELRVLDLCTGTGCIPLLFRHEFTSNRKDFDLRIVGIDISDKSIGLAHYNLLKNERIIQARAGMTNFAKADVLADPFGDLTIGAPLPVRSMLNHNKWAPFWDILISNPPYISPSAYWKTTTRSVRGFEPKLALVPPPKSKFDDRQQGDMFYPRLLKIAEEVEAKIVLLEVADLEQALRVAQLAQKLDVFDGIEIWRDEPDVSSSQPTNEDGFHVYGEGNARSVVCWRSEGGSWLGKSSSPKPPELLQDAPEETSSNSYWPPSYYQSNEVNFNAMPRFMWKRHMGDQRGKPPTRWRTPKTRWREPA
ncbi:S-adenosyl-L-methionine-dependent methyltransferase [Macroventuria anomochaeta]|uniref:S-adenosyl-L-methionine-dependent methyltransferase n=1 Tax=Macroventuria anomochaeta TaxID=301207 RepID=A0ACB6SH76_9PLEO|nr:S-adenosyl-L-methionine-dependent methyltransferase [Macroventuria anomochaeta]KAF2633348.1 S-adenosyl-L-methionine-dependent methyltransferase [Macroventuria anomochaeta]